MTVIDETHLCMMVPEIGEVHENVFVIHLVRRTSTFVTSHLFTEAKGSILGPRAIIRRLCRLRDRALFFDRHDFLPGMAREQVIDAHPYSKFGLMLRDAGYDYERIMRSPAAVRLLAYWHFCYHAAQEDGAKCFGERFRMVRYEEFAAAPDTTMANLYAWIEEEPPMGIDYTDVHPAKPPFHADDRR